MLLRAPTNLMSIEGVVRSSIHATPVELSCDLFFFFFRNMVFNLDFDLEAVSNVSCFFFFFFIYLFIFFFIFYFLFFLTIRQVHTIENPSIS